MRRLMMFGVAVWVGVVSAAAFGQTYYLPQQYQYTMNSVRGENSFYYAGNDRAVFAAEARLAALPSRARFAAYRGLRLYSDLLPGENAATYSFSTADIVNESNRLQPGYFSKRQIQAGATVLPDGTRLVPSGGGSVSSVASAGFSQGPVQAIGQNTYPARPGYISVIMKRSGGIMGRTSKEAQPSCPSPTSPVPPTIAPSKPPRSASF